MTADEPQPRESDTSDTDTMEFRVDRFIQAFGDATVAATRQWQEFSDTVTGPVEEARRRLAETEPDQRQLLESLARVTGEVADVFLRLTELGLDAAEKQGSSSLDRAGAIGRRLVGMMARTVTEATGGPLTTPSVEPRVRTLTLEVQREEGGEGPDATEWVRTYVINRGDHAVQASVVASPLVGWDGDEWFTVPIENILFDVDGSTSAGGVSTMQLDAGRRSPLRVQVRFPNGPPPVGVYRGLMTIRAEGQESAVLLALTVKPPPEATATTER